MRPIVLLSERDVQRFANLSTELGFDALTRLQNGGGACASLHGLPPVVAANGELFGSAGGYVIFLFPQDSGHIRF